MDEQQETPAPNNFRSDAQTYVRAMRALERARRAYSEANERLALTTREAAAAEKQLEDGRHLVGPGGRELAYRTAVVDGEVLMIERDRNALAPRIKIRLVPNPE